ncbi:unnamed protein product [Trichogramma brassicae]|uniref:Retrotransposon gag domain-containing protein n=1 Tax=Trichogramma brassicae TaxID=86971 RepID=A0A6H5IMK7_9HYME|nr:unnamed protein product [Trichogramma brassicae]
MFITRLMTCAGSYQLSLDNICRTLPAVLDMEACAWLERKEREWNTLDDMAEAFRLQYCDEGTQQCLRQEIEVRTQGPKEEISVFLLKIRLLLDQMKPPLCMSEQIDRAYMNLHPSHRRAFSREQCVNFRELQKLGKLEEPKRRQELAYREPPKSEKVMFRNAAYIESEESNKSVVVLFETMSNMEEYATTMKQFLLSRTNRSIFRDIKKLDNDVLVAELVQRGCNTYGSRPILEERLLRAKLREEPTSRQTVPWFEFDIEGAEEREPVTMRDPLPKRKRHQSKSRRKNKFIFATSAAEVHTSPPNGRRSGAAAQQPVAVDEDRQTIPRQPLQSREKFVVPDQQLMMDEAVYKIVQDGDYQYRAFSRRTQTIPMQALAGEHTQQTVPTFPKPPVPRPRRSLCMLERSRQNELNAEYETRQASREINNAPRQHHQSASQTQPVVGTNRASNAPQYSAPRVNANDRDSRGDARRSAKQTRSWQEPNYDDIQQYESELEQPSSTEIEHEWRTPLPSSTRRPSRVDYEADESDSSVYRTPMMTTPRINTRRDARNDLSQPRTNLPAPVSNTPWAPSNFGRRVPVNRVIEPDFSDESDVKPRNYNEPRCSSVRGGTTPHQSIVATGADVSLKVWKLVQGWRLRFSGEDKNEDAEALTMETDRVSEEVVVTEKNEEVNESWIQAINATEQMIESISPPLLSLVTSDADSTIEETEVPMNGKDKELYKLMSGRASRQEDEAVKQQHA